MLCQLETGVTKGKALSYNNKGKQNVESNTDDAVVRVCCDLLPMRVNFFCKRLTYISKVLFSELEEQKRAQKKWREVRPGCEGDV